MVAFVPMQLFDAKILDLLRPELGSEPIYYIGLGAFDFQLAFGNLRRVQNMLKVDFRLQGVEYNWEHGPCAVPAWLLIDQIPTAVSLDEGAILRISLQSGDWVRLHTEERPYECQIFEWVGSKGEAITFEVY
jgi:hypothetical protein